MNNNMNYRRCLSDSHFLRYKITKKKLFTQKFKY